MLRRRKNQYFVCGISEGVASKRQLNVSTARPDAVDSGVCHAARLALGILRPVSVLTRETRAYRATPSSDRAKRTLHRLRALRPVSILRYNPCSGTRKRAAHLRFQTHEETLS